MPFQCVEVLTCDQEEAGVLLASYPGSKNAGAKKESLVPTVRACARIFAYVTVIDEK